MGPKFILSNCPTGRPITKNTPRCKKGHPKPLIRVSAIPRSSTRKLTLKRAMNASPNPMLRRRKILPRSTTPRRITLPVANEANAAARSTAEGETRAVIVVATVAVADAGAAGEDAAVVGVAEAAGVTSHRADEICRLRNMLRRKAANRAAKIEAATTIAASSTVATITGDRKGRARTGHRLPLKQEKNRFSSRANRWQSIGANPR